MNRLKELRKEKNITQKDFSKVLKIPLRTLQNWENSESQIKPENAKILANFLGVSEGYLLGYTDNRFLDNQIIDNISERLESIGGTLNEVILENTLKFVKLIDFLKMDLDTISDLYFYNLNSKKPIRALNDLFDFFDSEFETLKECLSIVEPYEANKILERINKINEYNEQLSKYLEEPMLEDIARELSNQITKDEWEKIQDNPEEERYYLSIAWDRMLKSKNDPETVLSTKRFTEVKNITDLETLDGLISDTLLANKLLDGLKQKILSSEIINTQAYNYEIEKVLSWLIDFNDALGVQKLDLISKNKK